jgi:hypothetical protein
MSQPSAGGFQPAPLPHTVEMMRAQPVQLPIGGQPVAPQASPATAGNGSVFGGGMRVTPRQAKVIRDLIINPQTRAYGLQIYAKVAQPHEPKIVEFGGRLIAIDPLTGQRQDITPAGSGFHALTSPQERARYGIPATDTAPYQVGPDGKLSRVGPTTSVTVNNQSDNSFAKTFGQMNAKDFFALRGQARDAVQTLNSNAQAIKLLNSGVITGFGANYKLALGKALQAAGVHYADDAIANTEAFAASRAREVGRIIKLFGSGTGLSDADREYANKAAAGQITLNEESIRRILEINNKQAQWIIQTYNGEAQHIDPRLSPFPLTIQMPDFSGQAQPQTAGGSHARTYNPATGKIE